MRGFGTSMDKVGQDIIAEDLVFDSERRGSGPLGVIYHNIWQHPLALAGLIIILILVLTAVFAPILAPFDP